MFCFQSISDKKNITWAQVKEIHTWEKPSNNVIISFSLYYNLVIKEYLKCFMIIVWMLYMHFSTSHRTILGHVYSIYKISNLKRKDTKWFILWMHVNWYLVLDMFKENSVEYYLNDSHGKEISKARQSRKFYH